MVNVCTCLVVVELYCRPWSVRFCFEPCSSCSAVKLLKPNYLEVASGWEFVLHTSGF